ncbi:MAG: protein-L-isoaspartate O-methyltransferase [Betaproteobacteria bacterium]|nr:protein-L-isoaspartate O-methyltransferase [Betaproteobacteria bacterium]
MDIEHARFNMVEQQIRTWEVLDPDVLDLLYVVRREEFVPDDKRNLALSDLEIPLGEGERMMAPRVESRIVQELSVRKGDRVLEVGTGSGYLTALLAHRALHVFSVEINSRLLAFGRRNLARHGAVNVTTELGDAAQGWEAHAPYDIVVLTGSTPVLPVAFLDQLKPGGRLFAIVGDPPVMSARLMTCDPEPSVPRSWHGTNLFETNFPPLVNALQPDRFRF